MLNLRSFTYLTHAFFKHSFVSFTSTVILLGNISSYGRCQRSLNLFFLTPIYLWITPIRSYNYFLRSFNFVGL